MYTEMHFLGYIATTVQCYASRLGVKKVGVGDPGMFLYFIQTLIHCRRVKPPKIVTFLFTILVSL